MAKSIVKENGYDVDLYYCVRNPREAVYLSELEKLNNPQIKIIPHFSDTDGFINANIIKENPDSMIKVFYLFTSPMIKALKKQFKNNGILTNAIYSEEFSL